jgi:hypothetical protein
MFAADPTGTVISNPLSHTTGHLTPVGALAVAIDGPLMVGSTGGLGGLKATVKNGTAAPR